LFLLFSVPFKTPLFVTLCAILNWQLACQLSVQIVYRIVSYRIAMNALNE